MIYEKFEDIKRVIRCHKWKKDRQLKRRRTDNSKEKGQKDKQQQQQQQNTTQKTKD